METFSPSVSKPRIDSGLLTPSDHLGLTPAEGSRKVPGSSIPTADNAGQNRVAFQDVAGEAAVPDLVPDVEPCSVQNAFQDLPRISTRVAR